MRGRPAGAPSEQVRPQPSISNDAKEGPLKQAHVSEHRHGWRMQGLSVPPLPAAARRRPRTVLFPHRSKGNSSVAVEVEPPPLAAELHEAGLGHLATKLCEDMACSTSAQLMRLSAEQLHALLDMMRLRPGMRAAILRFVAERRASLVGTLPPPPRGRRAANQWRMTRELVRTTAQLRARSCEHGPMADLTNVPFINWARPRGACTVAISRSDAHISSVRVLRVGRGRVVQFPPSGQSHRDNHHLITT
jgi:hypothetical protein